MLHRKRIKTKFRDFFPSDDRDKTNETLKHKCGWKYCIQLSDIT